MEMAGSQRTSSTIAVIRPVIFATRRFVEARRVRVTYNRTMKRKALRFAIAAVVGFIIGLLSTIGNSPAQALLR